MGFATSAHVDLGVPCPQDGDSQAGGGTEAEETDTLARLNGGDPQTAEADDTGAEQRSSMGAVETGWKRVCEVGADESVFGVAAIDGVSGEGGAVAEVLGSAKAVGTGAVGSSYPRDADSRAKG